MDEALKWAMQLSYDLDGITDRLSILSLIGQAIDRSLPGDTGGLVQADIPRGTVTISGNPHGSVQPETTTTLARVVMSHPKAISYLSNPDDLRPRRMTDILGDRAWRAHPVYHELFLP